MRDGTNSITVWLDSPAIANGSNRLAAMSSAAVLDEVSMLRLRYFVAVAVAVVDAGPDRQRGRAHWINRATRTESG